jgi:hypothetical protein
LEFGRHERKRERLLAAFGERDRLACFGRRQRSERIGENFAGFEASGDALRHVVGDIEPGADAIDPRPFGVGEALRRRRLPQRLAEQPLPVDETLRISTAADGARQRDDPFARPFTVAAMTRLRRTPGL